MSFYLKVAGVTYDGRQALIRNLNRTGELDENTELVLKREPNNPYDTFAIGVLTQDGHHLGYIPKDRAKQMSVNMNSGMEYQAYVSTVTGGDAGFAYGLNIRIECNETPITKNKNSNQDQEPSYNDPLDMDENPTSYTETKAMRTFNLFIKALDELTNFKYSQNPNNLCISINQLRIDAPQKSIDIFIHVRDFDVVIQGTYDNFYIPTENLADTFELIARINNEYIYPHIIFDFNDYNVCCRYRQIFPNELHQTGFAAETMLAVGFHLERCGKALMAVSLGLQSPEEALKSISNN